MTASMRKVVVYGAYGHTGRFVVAELLLRGLVPILSGRDVGRLETLADEFPGLERRPARIDDPASLDYALQGASGVIHCAGPFLDTANAMVEAALRGRIHYIDLAAEQRAALDIFERYDQAVRTAGVAVMPAMAFYGGLADLLATAAMGDWPDADRIEIAVALDSWHPTAGTRITGARNQHRRMVVSGGALKPLPDPAPTRQWDYPQPFGNQEAVELPLSEIVTISRHLRSAEVHSYMNLAPLRDLRDPATPPPQADDQSGRSAQTFLVDVRVRRRGQERRASASGRDIYAFSAPLVGEAMERLIAGQASATGTIAAGQAFDACDFLAALAPAHLAVAGM